MDFINPTVVKLAAAQLQIPSASSKKNNPKLYFSLHKYPVSYPNSNEAILMPCYFSYREDVSPQKHYHNANICQVKG